jgi:hypothetical protein
MDGIGKLPFEQQFSRQIGENTSLRPEASQSPIDAFEFGRLFRGRHEASKGLVGSPRACDEGSSDGATDRALKRAGRDGAADSSEFIQYNKWGTDRLREYIERWERLKAKGLAIGAEVAKSDMNRALKISACGRFRVDREYRCEIGHFRMVHAQSCNCRRHCPLCIRAGGIQNARRFSARVVELLTEYPNLRPWMITFTVANGPDLRERFEHLVRALRVAMVERPKNFRKGRRSSTIFAVPWAAVSSVEIKRGDGSGEWHPHCHMLWMVPDDAGWGIEYKRWFDPRAMTWKEKPVVDGVHHRQLCDEWLEITGDSKVVNATPLKSALLLNSGSFNEGQIFADCLEVFKYFCKFGDLRVADVCEAASVTAHRQLIRSYGEFRGVQVPENVVPDVVLSGPFFEYYHRWEDGTYKLGYARAGGTSNQANSAAFPDTPLEVADLPY